MDLLQQTTQCNNTEEVYSPFNYLLYVFLLVIWMSTEGLKVSVHQGIFVHRYVKLLKFLS